MSPAGKILVSKSDNVVFVYVAAEFVIECLEHMINRRQFARCAHGIFAQQLANLKREFGKVRAGALNMLMLIRIMVSEHGRGAKRRASAHVRERTVRIVAEIQLGKPIVQLMEHCARIAERVVLVAKHVGVLRLVKEHTIGSERRNGLGLELLGGRFELLVKVVHIGHGSLGQKLKQIIVQSFGARSVDDHVRYGERFEQHANAFLLVVGRAEQTFRVEDERVGDGVEGAPHAHRARLLLVGRFKYAATVEERMIERVRFAVARVAKYGHTLD